MKAFPTAEGYGENATGGRGGLPAFIDNLNDSGPGSAREALLAPGARYVIPRVSGTVVLQTPLTTRSGNVTYAGQASPGGLQFRGPNNGKPAGIMFQDCPNIIVRHMRVRMGGPCADDTGEPLLCYGSGEKVHDVIFDHCSIQWGTDAIMYYGTPDNGVYQWCIFAEGADSMGSPGSGKGLHVLARKFNDHHNLYANNAQRNPLYEGAQAFDSRNNVVYNWGGGNGAEYGVLQKNQAPRGNVVANLYIAGPDSHTPYYLVGNGSFNGLNVFGQATQGTKLWTSNNWGPLKPNGPANDADDFKQFFTADFYYKSGADFVMCDPAVFRLAAPLPLPFTIETDDPGVLLDKVLATVGACKPFRDSADAKVINDVVNRTGCTSATSGCIGNGGPWPDLATGAPAPPRDTNNDGVPDFWAKAYGYDVNATIANNIDPANGYPIIENYLNWLAGDFPDLVVSQDPDADPADPTDPLPTEALARPLTNPEWLQFQEEVNVAGLTLPTMVKWQDKAILAYETASGLFLTDVTAILSSLNVTPSWTYEAAYGLWNLPGDVLAAIQEKAGIVSETEPGASSIGPIIALLVAGLLVWKVLAKK